MSELCCDHDSCEIGQRLSKHGCLNHQIRHMYISIQKWNIFLKLLGWFVTKSFIACIYGVLHVPIHVFLMIAWDWNARGLTNEITFAVPSSSDIFYINSGWHFKKIYLQTQNKSMQLLLRPLYREFCNFTYPFFLTIPWKIFCFFLFLPPFIQGLF